MRFSASSCATAPSRRRGHQRAGRCSRSEIGHRPVRRSRRSQTGNSCRQSHCDEKISFVIGHFYSSITLAASEIYANHSILEITPSATNPQVTEGGFDLVFRTSGRDDQQKCGRGKISCRSDGQEDRDPVRQYRLRQRTRGRCPPRLSKAGIQDALYAGIDKDTKDYGRLVGRIKAAAADLVYWAGDADAGLLLREMRAEGVTAQLLG